MMSGIELTGPLELRAKPLVVDLELLLFSCLCDQRGKFRDAVGLGQIIVSAELHGFDRGFDRGLAGEHDHLGRVLALFAQAAEQAHPVEPRHIHIAQKNVEILLLEQFPRRFAVVGLLDLVALAAQFFLHDHAQVFFVIYY